MAETFLGHSAKQWERCRQISSSLLHSFLSDWVMVGFFFFFWFLPHPQGQKTGDQSQLSETILPTLDASREGISFLWLQETNKALNDFPFAALVKLLCLCGLFIPEWYLLLFQTLLWIAPLFSVQSRVAKICKLTCLVCSSVGGACLKTTSF